MRFGVMVGADGASATVDDILKIAQRVEAAGLDSMWMANIFSLDAIMTLATVARETKLLPPALHFFTHQ